MKLSDLARELKGAHLNGGDVEIKALCTDSRVAEAGDLFFCFRGTHSDSHDYALEAVRRGAAAIVAERELDIDCPALVVSDGREAMARIAAAFYRHPERKLKIVGITGTNGKTTTSFMLRNILSEAGVKAGLIGTLGVEYGTHKIAPSLTTPDPVYLFSLLADMAQAGVEVVVMEVSAHALYLKKECPIEYELAIFTNLTRDHLDFFEDMTAYGNAKRSLFQKERCRYAILNADDPFSQTLKEVPHITYGIDTPADTFAIIQSESLKGSHIILNLDDELMETKLAMMGSYNVLNALAAANAGRLLGADARAIERGLSRTTSVSGRLEWVASHAGAEIFVDFAHTPDGLQKSLGALKDHCKGKLVVLFGCGGNRDRGKRAAMGETAAREADFAVLTSDNPRYEDPCGILSEIEEGFRSISKQYVIIEDREKATEYAINQLEKGDVLLVAGKGGETYQEIMGIKYGYDDKDVIRSILGKLQ